MTSGPAHSARSRHNAACAGMIALTLVLWGCSPALNWREVRLEEPGLVALFPCRPVAQTRAVNLAGLPLSMKLQACEADGGTYAVMVVQVSDPSSVNAVLESLRDTSLAKLDAPAGASAARAGWQVAGMTPQPAAGRWTLLHARGEDKPVRMDTALFARGPWVIQASVIGPASAPEGSSAPFFEGLVFAH